MGTVDRRIVWVGNTIGTKDSSMTFNYTVDALVVLLDFDKGKVVQVPFSWIKLLNEENDNG